MDNIINFFDNNNSFIDFENDNIITSFNNYISLDNTDNYISLDNTDNYILNNIHYYPDKNLNKNIKINKLNIDNTLICLYKIINCNENPFLLFYLINKNNKFVFPDLYHFNHITHFNNLNSLDEILDKLYNIFDKNIYSISFSGLDDSYNDKSILWFRLKENSNLKLNYDNEYSWISLYEIININQFLNLKIDNFITNYFLSNEKLIYLTYYNHLENKDINIDIPIIAFYGNTKYHNNFILNFDILRESNKSYFGSYYYFCNYNLLKKYIPSNKYNFIRYAIFIKKYKYLFNNEIFNLSLWNHFDTIIYNYSNNRKIKYIIKNKNNIIPLSLH